MKRIFFIYVCLISIHAFAQTEYYLGVLVGEADKPESQELLMNDPVLKHDILVSRYKEEKGLEKAPKVLWAGEIEKVDGKYTRINETSQSYFKQTPEGLKHIKDFMDRAVPYEIDYIEYSKENEHLSPVLKVLKDLRHNIRGEMGKAYLVLNDENPLAVLKTIGEDRVLDVLRKCIDDISEIKRLMPNKSYDGLNGLYSLAIELYGMLAVQDIHSIRYYKANKMEYFMDLLNLFSAQPSLKNKSIVIETEAKTDEIKTENPSEETQAPVRQGQEINLIETKEKIYSLNLISPNYYSSDQSILDFVKEINSKYYVQNVPDLITELFKKITKEGMDQKDIMIMFRSGLSEYMEANKDINDNLELLILFISYAYNAEKDGYINIHLDYDKRMRSLFADNYGTYVSNFHNNSKLSDNEKLMIVNTAKMLSIKTAEPTLPIIKK